ncbi:MAG: DNA mismatch endonuclease Vsr [Phycisphaeraceae bacterium]|nr:MAG: DNA mismatch endonuclease Vsr [Phycisphaeraceae bacterium]
MRRTGRRSEVDNLSPGARSRAMRGVRSHDTTPERIVRSVAHSLGFRFRLKRRDLPGSPDLTFPRLRAVVFVHGCYWHQHRCPRGARQPKTNRSYWLPKLRRNVERDRRAIRALRRDGWRVLVVWECQTRDNAALSSTLKAFLSHRHSRRKPRRQGLGRPS